MRGKPMSERDCEARKRLVRRLRAIGRISDYLSLLLSACGEGKVVLLVG